VIFCSDEGYLQRCGFYLNCLPMKNSQILLVSSLLVSSGIVGFAQEPGKKPSTPKQPWSDYVVHDGTRPVPEKVKTHGAVIVKAPEDADVLFDGKSSSEFSSGWEVKDGVMVATKRDASSKKKYGSCQLHIEWRVPAGRKIENQKGGNSGVFFMGAYEVQVMESYKNVTYADGQAGALYGQTPPRVNASAPQGEWQSYDITFEAPKYDENGMVEPAYVTVIHNGVVVHHRQKYHGPTVFRKVAKYPKKHPEKGPLKLQFHGDPIEYRNIWVREL